MPYHVQIDRETLDYLEALPHVSAAKLADVLDQVVPLLENVADHFREERRIEAGIPCFLFDFAFQDEDHGHRLLFYVDDSHAVAGVLVVTFVDHQFGPSS